MKNIKLKIIILVLIVFIQKVYTQNPPMQGEYFYFSAPITTQGDNKYEARYCITMLPGFTFNSNKGSFNALVNYKVVLPVSYNNPINPDNRPFYTGTDFVPGTIKGDFSVGSCGDANYNIPIDLPPGTGGLVPKLGIQYNHNSKNGLLGVGFNLYGFSAITNGPKKTYFAGIVRPVKFDQWDELLLNGEHLYIFYNGGYTTENISTKIFKPVPSWVVEEDGKIYKYGYSADSKIMFNDENLPEVAYTRLLSEVVDANSNYIKYYYHNDPVSGEWWPESIEYAGNYKLGIQPSVKIIFTYNKRSDNQLNFDFGMQINRTVLLKGIMIESEGKVIKEYTFDYSEDFYSHLNSITLKAGNLSLNSTVFTWENQTLTNSIIHPTNIVPCPNSVDNAMYQMLSGDFNGDGKTEILKLCKGTLGWQIYGCDANNNIALKNSGSFGWHFVYNDENFNIDKWFAYVNKSFCLDVDLDGKAELVLVAIDDNNHYALQIFKFDGNNFNVINETALYAQRYLGPEPTGDDLNFIMPMSDLRGYDLPVIRYEYYTTNGNSSAAIGYEYNRDDNSLVWKKIDGLTPQGWALYESVSGDFDGDGVNELIGNNGGTFYHLIWHTGPNAGWMWEQHYLHPVFPFDLSEMIVADINGDKISDFIVKKDGYWKLYFIDGQTDWRYAGHQMTGLGFVEYNSPIPIPATMKLITSDFNGDGKTDILICKSSNDETNPSAELVALLYSNGAGFELGDISDVHDLAIFNCPNPYPNNKPRVVNFEVAEKLLGDFNGDGKTDYYDGENLVFFEPNSQKHLVHTIQNGLNERIDIQYKPLTDPTVYTKETDAVYPITDMMSPLYVVSNVRYDHANINPWENTPPTGNYDVTYKYIGAKVHSMGKGLLGFHEICEWNTISQTFKLNVYDIKSLPIFHCNNYIPVLTKTDVWDFKQNKHLYTEDNEYEYTSFLSLRKTKTVNTNHLTEVESTTDYLDIDPVSLKYQTIVTTIKNLNDADDSWTTRTEYTYQNILNYNGAFNILGLPLTEKIIQSKPGVPTTTKYNRYYYNDDGTLRQAVTEPTNMQMVVKDYAYNSIGLVKSVTETTGDCEPRTSYVEYDNKYRYATKKTNLLGHCNTFEYDKYSGNLLKETNANGLSKYYQYDDLGRLIKTIYPDGTYTSSVLLWTPVGFENRTDYSMYANKTSSSGNPDIFVFYDKLGRELRKKTLNISGIKILTLKYYDHVGRLIYESKPYTSNDDKYDPPHFVYTYYDDGTNFLKTKKGIGFNMDLYYTYDKTKTTVTDNLMGSVLNTTTDAAGHISLSEDAGGQVANTYYSNGLLKDSKVNSGPLISMTYDDFGRQTEIIDPNAGITNYIYNGFGELTKQASNKGEFEISYDVLGRMIKRTDKTENIVTSWTYDTQLNGKGLLANVTSSDGYVETYTYDNLSRIKNKAITIDGTSYTSLSEYDNLGRLSYYTYPSGLRINYLYENGFLKKLVNTADNSDIWECKNVNADGQITQYQMGNGLNTYKTYNEMGQVTNITTGALQNLTYIYNNKYQLTERTDVVHNTQSESFAYDENMPVLNRLSKTTTNNQSIVSLSYSDNGNIDSKSDVGTYLYHSEKINAVENITMAPGCPISTQPQSVKYTSFNKVNYIGENGKYLDIAYDANRNRVKSVYSDNSGIQKTKYYIGGNYEKEISANGTVRELSYIAAGDGLIAITEKKNGNSAIYYILKDNQGSYHAVTNAFGNVVSYNGQAQVFSFDAWGRRRNPNNWNDYNVNINALFFDRGYTGHEHLDQFGLINMNGRVYDPVICRFLSPDLLVQNPGSTQSFNRYSYCFNNPLAYSDPSGYRSGGSDYNQVMDSQVNENNSRLQNEHWNSLNAIYEAASGNGVSTIYGAWVEGKLVVFSQADVNNFQETGAMNEALKAFSGFKDVTYSEEDLKAGVDIVDNIQTVLNIMEGFSHGSTKHLKAIYVNGESASGKDYTYDKEQGKYYYKGYWAPAFTEGPFGNWKSKLYVSPILFNEENHSLLFKTIWHETGHIEHQFHLKGMYNAMYSDYVMYHYTEQWEGKSQKFFYNISYENNPNYLKFQSYDKPLPKNISKKYDLYKYDINAEILNYYY